MKRPVVVMLFAVLSHWLHAQEFEWVKLFAAGPIFGSSAICSDRDGNVYVSGIFRNEIVINGQTITSGTTSSEDSYIIKFNPSGNVVWVKQIGAEFAREFIYGMEIDHANNLVATGFFSWNADFGGIPLTTGYFDGNAFLMKMSSDGEVLWAKDIGTVSVNLHEVGDGIAVDGEDNIYVSGVFVMDGFVAKYSPEGSLHWIRRFGGNSSLVSSDYGTDVEVDDAGNAYVVGAYQGIGSIGNYQLNSQVDGEGFVFKITKDGEVAWVKTFFGLGSRVELHDDRVFISGAVRDGKVFDKISTGFGGLFAAFNTSGALQWSRIVPNFGGADITMYQGDNIFFSGYNYDNVTLDDYSFTTSGGIRKSIIGSMAADGTIHWATHMGQPHTPTANLLHTDKDGNVYVANELSGPDPGKFGCSSVTGNQSDINEDQYLAKIVPFRIVPILGPSLVCPGTTHQFSFQPISEYVDYQWDLSRVNNSHTLINANTVSVTFNNNTPAVIRLKTPADPGCETFVINNSRTVNLEPPLTQKSHINGNPSMCVGDERVFTIEEPVVPGNIVWTVPPDLQLIDSSPLQIRVKATTPIASQNILVAIGNTCSSVYYDPLAVNVLPVVGVPGEIQGPEEVCSDDKKLVYTIPAIANASEYVWSFSGNGQIEGTNITSSNKITVNLNNASFGSVSVYGTNSCGSTEQVTKNLSVKSRPEVPKVPLGPSGLCENALLTFLTDPVENVTHYQWKFSEQLRTDGITNFQAITPYVIFNAKSDGLISVRAVNECGVSNYSGERVIDVISIKEFVVPEIIRSCNTLTHAHREPLIWLIDGVEVSRDRTLTMTTAGNYQLVYETPCGDLSDAVDIVESDVVVFIPNIITPNGDGKNDKFILSNALADASVMIYNRWGKLIFSAEAYDNNWEAENVPNGVYYYRVKQCNGTAFSGSLTIMDN